MKKPSKDPNPGKTTGPAVRYDIVRGRHRARMTAVLLDESTRRVTGYGDNDAEALSSIRDKLSAINEEIMYGIKKADGDITLSQAVRDLVISRREAFDREKGREAIRDTTSKRDEDV